MTTEEILEMEAQGMSVVIDEHGKKDANVTAEIISILQREKYSYTNASDLLKKCDSILLKIAKI